MLGETPCSMTIEKKLKNTKFLLFIFHYEILEYECHMLIIFVISDHMLGTKIVQKKKNHNLFSIYIFYSNVTKNFISLNYNKFA